MLCLFMFGGLIAFTGKAASASCKLEVSPPRVVVKYGDSFSVNCSSLYSETQGMGWESTHGGISLTTGVTSLPFNISSVDAWVIQPSCYVNLPNGEQCEEDLPVTVYQMPESVSIAQPLSAMVEGQQYPIECDIVNVAPANHLSVYWHKGNKIIHHDTLPDATQTPVSKTSILNLTAQRDDDGMPIWCEAKLDFGLVEQNPPAVQSKSHKVTVLYPPTFTKPEAETVEISASEKITLNCNAMGNPMPVYSWHFPQAVQEASKNENVNHPILTPSLQFPGNYSCEASNSQGTSRKYFTVVEATRKYTTLAAIIGVFAALGVLLVIGGLLFVKPDGTFSFIQSKYIRGQPSGPI
ncbi:intercellular adhesion molecule 2 [Stegastes partitus]|uniref:Intercellular adhesion molecule 2 n=1 Tax=Stegastes partitus TaxID=144197 RepID=A0A3B4ZGF7_9TELE|nr:PREDICTED: intercellular adhesion molecule 2 [Stegastes partitus]